jgi:hypothetical protein
MRRHVVGFRRGLHRRIGLCGRRWGLITLDLIAPERLLEALGDGDEIPVTEDSGAGLSRGHCKGDGLALGFAGEGDSWLLALRERGLGGQLRLRAQIVEEGVEVASDDEPAVIGADISGGGEGDGERGDLSEGERGVLWAWRAGL